MFFIVWTGWGILAPLLLIFSTFILSIGVNAFMHSDSYADMHHWIYAIGALLGGIPCWFFGKKLNSKPGRILVDPKTDELIEFKKTHSCFYIPFEYWAIIAVIASVVILFK